MRSSPFRQNIGAMRDALSALTDAQLDEPWALKAGPHVFSQPRGLVYRTSFSPSRASPRPARRLSPHARVTVPRCTTTPPTRRAHVHGDVAARGSKCAWHRYEPGTRWSLRLTHRLISTSTSSRWKHAVPTAEVPRTHANAIARTRHVTRERSAASSSRASPMTPAARGVYGISNSLHRP